MAIVMIMEWQEVTRATYDAVRAEVDWVGNPPAGGILHVAGFDEVKGMRVVDVWESAADFQNFSGGRIAESMQKAGLTTEPKVEFFPVYKLDVQDLAALQALH